MRLGTELPLNWHPGISVIIWTWKKSSSITHVAVIKSLTPRSVSTGCLLHLSLIWLLALIWGSATLTGIQSSFCTRSVAAAASSESTSALCEEPGEETLSNKVSLWTNTSFTHPLRFFSPEVFHPLPLSQSLSALSDKVQRLKSAARNCTCLCKWLSSLSLPRFWGLNTLKVKSHFPSLAAELVPPLGDTASVSDVNSSSSDRKILQLCDLLSWWVIRLWRNLLSTWVNYCLTSLLNIYLNVSLCSKAMKNVTCWDVITLLCEIVQTATCCCQTRADM